MKAQLNILYLFEIKQNPSAQNQTRGSDLLQWELGKTKQENSNSNSHRHCPLLGNENVLLVQ